MDERERLGRAIRRARLWRNLTQAQLAASIGTTARTIGRWERGEDAPPLLSLGPLCDALGVPAEYFRRAPHEDVDRLLLE
jgi:transcriptional regulator with XRE-family HTH domain